MNSELINDDIEACSKYAQSVPIKSSLKRHNHCREHEVMFALLEISTQFFISQILKNYSLFCKIQSS